MTVNHLSPGPRGALPRLATNFKRAVAEYGRRTVQKTRVNVDNEHINQTVLARSVLVGNRGSSSWTFPTVLHWHWRFESFPLGHFLDPYINGQIRSLIISWLQVRVLPGPPISWNTNRRESPFEVFGVSMS